MRGLLMALFAFEFPGHGSGVTGAIGMRARSTKTTAKTTTTTV